MIWWVRSEEPVILANDYIELADKLGLEKGSGKTEELIDALDIGSKTIVAGCLSSITPSISVN